MTYEWSDFNPLGRKTETPNAVFAVCSGYISIHSVARPRHQNQFSVAPSSSFQSTRSQDRDQNPLAGLIYCDISIHSVARPRQQQAFAAYCFADYFNPLGRKTETYCFGWPGSGRPFQSTRSQDRDSKTKQLLIILPPFLYTFHT